MEEGFQLPVNYKDQELLFPAQLVCFGWTQRIQVEVYGTSVFFERDEEREWRAVADPEAVPANKQIDIDLVKAMASSIETILK